MKKVKLNEKPGKHLAEGRTLQVQAFRNTFLLVFGALTLIPGVDLVFGKEALPNIYSVGGYLLAVLTIALVAAYFSSR